jgi:hypothetical protein
MAVIIAISLQSAQAALAYVSFGLIDRTGKAIIPAKYVLLRYVGHGQYWAVANHETGGASGVLLDKDGRELHLNLPDGCQPVSFDGDTIIIKGPKGMGVTDPSGRIIIPPEYGISSHFAEDRIVAAKQQNSTIDPNTETQYVVFDRSGKEIGKLPAAGLYLRQAFSDGLLIWQTDNPFGATGYLDSTGRFVLKPGLVTVRGEAGDFSDGFAAVDVLRGPKKGAAFIDRQGNVAIGPFAQVQQFQHGLAIVEQSPHKKNHWGVINRRGQFVIQPKYTFLGSLGKSTFVAQADTNWLVINAAGKKLLSLPKEIARVYTMQVLPKGGLYTWNANPCTSEVAPDVVLSIPLPVDENALLRRIPCALAGSGSSPARWGFSDQTGRMIIVPAYDTAWPFRFGAAVVRTKNKYATYAYGLIDESGKWILKPEYGLLWQTEPDRVIVGIGPSGFDPTEWRYHRGYGYGVSKRKQFDKLVRSHPLIGLSRAKLSELIGDGDKWLFSSSAQMPMQAPLIKPTADEPIYMLDSGGCLGQWSGFQVHFDKGVVTRWRFVTCSSAKAWITTNEATEEAATKLNRD